LIFDRYRQKFYEVEFRGSDKICLNSQKSPSGIEPAGPTLPNLLDRTKPLETGVGKFSIISLFETDYSVG
jgi:hypothetical protein